MKMKKIYLTPTMRVVKLRHHNRLLAGSGERSVKSLKSSNVPFRFDGDGIGDDAPDL